MGRLRLLAVVAGTLLVILSAAAPAGAANGHANYRAVCPSPPNGYAYCHELVVTDAQGNPLASGSPTGLAPATIQSVYGFPTASTIGAGETIALVDAYDDPNAESDLRVFSSTYGLPACTTASGCFRKVNQSGGTSYPKADSGWALEISLDIQWAHAIAPGATILLVEASSNSFSNLLAAEDYAKAHAQYVSNSWGGSESSGESAYDSNFVQPGVSFFVSAGDSGLPAEYPSASPNVISVGGTALNFSGGTFVSETGWSSGGGGCSAYEIASAAQSSFSQYGQAGCGGSRATPDVALDADPNSGVSVYDSVRYQGQSGWFTVGGTSASSPMWAARSADAGTVVDASYVYGNSIAFRDITSGNNGASCLVGYDLCSGRGSWTGSGSGQTQPGLGFATSSQSLTAGQASAAMQVAISPAQSAAVTVSLSSSSAGGQFSTSPNGPWSSSGSVTIAAGATTSGSFYYEDTVAGSPTLTAGATDATSGTQTETVAAAAAVSTIAVSPGSASVQAGGRQQFTAAGADRYGNPVAVSPTWSTSFADATLSPATGSTTTFTAGNTTGTGTVAATSGSVSGSASVMVTAARALTPPTNLVANPQGKHISLTWQDDGSAVSYNVYRGTVSGQESLLASNVTSTAYNDMSVASRQPYYYLVTAVAADGSESAPSSEASAAVK